MRVLVVNPSPIRGGAEQMLDAFARGCDPSRLSIEVACLAPGPFPDELAAAGVAVHPIHAGRMRQVHRWAATVRRLARLARSFDAVCSWQVKGHYYGTPAARIARRPALWWDHGIRPVRGEPSAFAAGSIPRALRADLVLASSRAAAARHPRSLAIHPGVDVAAFAAASSQRERVRASLGASGGEPVVGIVGRLQPWKGQHVFLRAAAHVAARHPETRFVVVGDAIGGFSASYPAELRSLASTLGIADRVVFAGHRADVAAVLSGFDVFVHASRDEPFGIVVVEALAAGVPVVATSGGGVDEIVGHGDTGLLVGHGNHEEMAAAVERYLADPAFAAATAARGRERAAREFGVARMIEEFTAVLERFAHRTAQVRA